MGTRSARTSDIEEIYRSLERIGRAQQRRRNAQLQANRSGVHLPPLSLAILSELHRHGAAGVKVLADRAEAELPRVSREIRSLEEHGLVDVHPEPSDRRSRLVALTPLGRQRWSAYQRAGHTVLEELLATWEDDDVNSFAGLLQRFLQRP